MRYLILFVAVLVFSFSTSLAAAQNKVVVVPLGGKKCTSPMENSFTNSIGMTFNLIPAGTFTMGSPADELGRIPNESQHQVTLTKSFYMSVTEVTNKQWNTLVVDAGLGVNPSSSHTGDEYPVEHINWYEAAGFANLLSLAEGLTICYPGNNCTGTPGVDFTCDSVTINPNCTGYRLPTEAQWEYAARAGTATAYANPYSFDASNTDINTDFNSNLAAMGWYTWNDTISGYTTGTKPVAQKQANRWGLFDMHGNVAEWCQDWYDPIYPTGSVTDPQGPTDGLNRVARGGSWFSGASSTRSAYRGIAWTGSRVNVLGFRLALPPGQ